MKISNDRPECCPKYLAPFPKDCACFCRELANEVKRLQHRHYRAFTKRRRILEMAEPVYHRVKSKVVPKCPCFIPRSIEIVRLDQPVRTRTEQLSFPAVWKLLLFKKRVKNSFPATRMYMLNRLIRSSLLSLYSHLYNVQPPEEPKPKVKWTAKDWAKHEKNLTELSIPKEAPPQPKIQRRSKPLSQLKRYKRLAEPRQYEPEWSNEWKFTPAMKSYKASDRMKELAVPRKVDEESMFRSLPIHPPESALKYKASARVKEMAEPIIKKSGGTSDVKDQPFGISPNALKAKCSKRTRELAEPKEFKDIHTNPNPGAISPAALTAKASPRIIELAKPKGSA